jgi:hypothetical protein
VAELRRRGLLAGQVCVAPAFGGEGEAVSTVGAIEAACALLDWDAALVGPGPGIVGSQTALGHGGMAALDSAHAALALGCATVLVPRLSAGDPRDRHCGLSHHSATVLELALRPLAVALPAEAPVGDLGERASDALAPHSPRTAPTDLEGYRSSGLSTRTMGRSIDDDPLFFRAGLAGGAVLAREL